MKQTLPLVDAANDSQLIQLNNGNVDHKIENSNSIIKKSGRKSKKKIIINSIRKFIVKIFLF
jgi:hypothetical protein